ncbi:MAG: phage infection protein [Lactobacillus sp.]|jgi:hypothetical protein|nr:phage infection protein [Lactobacillus sp.]MCI2033239.1 phage infection protein [Lactobacillus sp.]
MTYADEIGEDAFNALVADFFQEHYRDRGMRKWQGYFLSDHTAALKQTAATSGPATWLPPQDQPTVRAQLAKAYANHQTVTAQLSARDPDGHAFSPWSGQVSGHDNADHVTIGARTVPISAIRHIKIWPFSTASDRR